MNHQKALDGGFFPLWDPPRKMAATFFAAGAKNLPTILLTSIKWWGLLFYILPSSL